MSNEYFKACPASIGELSNVRFDKVKSDVKTTYQQMRELIESLTEQQLFNRAHYSWTKKNNFATYLISASSSHYNWANVRIKRKFKDKLKLKQKTLSIQETAAQRKPE